MILVSHWDSSSQLCGYSRWNKQARAEKPFSVCFMFLLFLLKGMAPEEEREDGKNIECRFNGVIYHFHRGVYKIWGKMCCLDEWV